MRNGKRNYIGSRLKECFDAIYNNYFGDTRFMHDYISGITNGVGYKYGFASGGLAVIPMIMFM